MDLTACSNKHCPKRASCYRYVGQMDQLQSMSLFNESLENDCEYYISVFEYFNVGKRNKTDYLKYFQQISDKRDQNI